MANVLDWLLTIVKVAALAGGLAFFALAALAAYLVYLWIKATD